jgi:hypothetical protein
MSLLSEALKRLLAQEQPLNASDFTQGQRKALEQFALNTRLIEVKKQGNGVVYRLIDRQSIRNYVRQLHPLDDEQLLSLLPKRSRNIGTDLSSKRGQSGHDSFYLLMKAWDSDVVWQYGDKTMNPSELTKRLGVAAMQVSTNNAWHCNRPLLLVENQALFDRCDWLPVEFNGCLVYYAGQLSDVVLLWFSEQQRASDVILFPDYDGIGLTNYARLAGMLHPNSTLHFYWLTDWENKLPVYGNAEVWSKTRIQFENAMQKLDNMNALNSDLIKLGQLSQRCGKALEQEAIWL